MVFNSNFKGAMSLLAEEGKGGGLLKVCEKVKEEMQRKHPHAEPAEPDSLLTGPLPPTVDPIFYEALDAGLIKKCALRTHGGAGVSQQEDCLWHKMVTSFKDTSNTLCSAVSATAQRLATEYVDPAGLEALLANRGIAIAKSSGLRPVGIGEIARRIIAKATSHVTGEEVRIAVGALQLCAGHPIGVESAIHAMRGFLDDDESEGILLIDADNGFNRVNRQAALWNVQYTCPPLKHMLANFYRSPTRILMNNEGSFELLSREGTTQGCPLAMAMYALALIPLTRQLQSSCKQVWYADDASGCDKLENLKAWFDLLLEIGPRYGYYPSPDKCILVVRPQLADKAKALFKDTSVNVMSDGSKDTGVEVNTHGTRHLGAAVGTDSFKREYVGKKVAHWVAAVKTLAEIAATEPLTPLLHTLSSVNGPSCPE